jgi:ectoine hydroxylase-related dioxygenase (phytanoyl-CoA dioxygenase family)
MSNYMIKGSWDNVRLVCCHRHDEPVPMEIQQGSTLFYACPKYHAENRTEDERACNNRLSLQDYTKMLEHLHEIMIKSELADEKINLTNHTWKDKKGIEYKVLQDVNGKLVVEVLNKKAIRS